MFISILLIEDRAASDALEQLAVESKQVVVARIINQFPSHYELVRVLNTHAPELVFLELTDWERALPLVNTIHSHSPETAIVGFGAEWIRPQEAQWAEVGVSALLITPLNLHRFVDSVDRAIHKVCAPMQDNLVAFLPAKAGNGATSVVLNVAGCLADPLEKRVLVIEGDLHSGILSVLLNVNPQHSILDALENSGSLDYTSWTSYKVRAHGIDFLLSRRIRKPALPSWSDYHQLLQFAMPRYDLILVDLPEVVNDATVEIVRRARSIFTICTPEVPALALAEQRWQELRSRGVSSERISILLNRAQRDGMQPEAVEDLLKLPVSGVFPNDYKSLQIATVGSQLVSQETELGKAFLAFARKLMGITEPPPTKSRLGFLKLLGAKVESS